MQSELLGAHHWKGLFPIDIYPPQIIIPLPLPSCLFLQFVLPLNRSFLTSLDLLELSKG